MVRKTTLDDNIYWRIIDGCIKNKEQFKIEIPNPITEEWISKISGADFRSITNNYYCCIDLILSHLCPHSSEKLEKTESYSHHVDCILSFIDKRTQLIEKSGLDLNDFRKLFIGVAYSGFIDYGPNITATFLVFESENIGDREHLERYRFRQEYGIDLFKKNLQILTEKLQCFLGLEKRVMEILDKEKTIINERLDKGILKFSDVCEFKFIIANFLRDVEMTGYVGKFSMRNYLTENVIEEYYIRHLENLYDKARNQNSDNLRSFEYLGTRIPYLLIHSTDNIDRGPGASIKGFYFVARDKVPEDWQQKIVAYHESLCQKIGHDKAKAKEIEIARDLEKEKEYKEWRAKIDNGF